MTGQHNEADLCGKSAPEDSGCREVAPVAWVQGAHHVVGVPHLTRQLGHRDGAVRLGAPRRERHEAGNEEVQPGKRHHVNGQLSEVAVQLAWETDIRTKQDRIWKSYLVT